MTDAWHQIKLMRLQSTYGMNWKQKAQLARWASAPFTEEQSLCKQAELQIKKRYGMSVTAYTFIRNKRKLRVLANNALGPIDLGKTIACVSW